MKQKQTCEADDVRKQRRKTKTKDKVVGRTRGDELGREAILFLQNE